MLEFLQFYTSGFWIWLGITAGMAVAVNGVVSIVLTLRRQPPPQRRTQ